MADRSTSLRRIAAVQKDLVRLSEWRVAAAEQLCRDLAADKQRLHVYVVEQGALGVTLAKAALRSLQAIDARLAKAERLRDAGRVALVDAKRREHAVDGLYARVDKVERRDRENRDLSATIDAWLSAQESEASLP